MIMDEDNIKDTVDEQRLQQTQGISGITPAGPTQATGGGLTSGSQGVFAADYASAQEIQNAELGITGEAAEEDSEDGSGLSVYEETDDSSGGNDLAVQDGEESFEDEDISAEEEGGDDALNDYTDEDDSSDDNSKLNNDGDGDDSVDTSDEDTAGDDDKEPELGNDDASQPASGPDPTVSTSAPGDVVTPSVTSAPGSDPTVDGDEAPAESNDDTDGFVGAVTSAEEIAANNNDSTGDGSNDSSTNDGDGSDGSAPPEEVILTAGVDVDPVNELIDNAFGDFNGGSGDVGDALGGGADD